MDGLESIMITKSEQQRQILYGITYMWILKKTKTQANDYNKKETDSQTGEQTSGCWQGEGKEEEHNRGKGLKGTNYYI